MEMQEPGMAPWVKDLRIERLKCGHWVQLEEKERLFEILVEFVGDEGGM